MRAAAVLVALLGASAIAQETDTSADGRAFVEADLPRETCFVDETVRVRVRIGFDAAWFRSHAIPMFRREMDVPAQLEAPWLRTIPGAVVSRDEAREAADARPRLTVAANDEVVAAARADDRTVGGRAFTVLEIERTLVPAAPGEIAIPAPALRFVYATRFDDDFVRGRTAADRSEARIVGAPRTLRVLALPEAGRPAEFSGAVGRFTVTADAAAREVTAGESFRVVLTITAAGDGNLERFPAPRLDGLRGFHVLGAIDDNGRVRRAITYDVAALGAEVKEFPAIRFAYFDPAPPGAYRETATAPIPIVVRASPAAGNSSPSAAREPERPDSGVRTVVLLLAAAAAVGAAIAVSRRRAHRGRDADADTLRADGAAAAFRARSATPGADLADVFAEYLAARLRCPAAAVVAPELPSRLETAGVPGGLASRTGDLLERLVAARYGGGVATPGDAIAARALVDEIDAAFRAAAAR